MRTAPILRTLALLAPLALLAGCGDSDDVYDKLEGQWRLKTEVIETRHGSFPVQKQLSGVLTVDGSDCRLRITDVTEVFDLLRWNAGASVTQQSCSIEQAGELISILSKVEEGPESYQPDNFELRLDDTGNVLRGQLVSVVNAPVEMHRIGEDTGLLLPTLLPSERKTAREKLGGFTLFKQVDGKPWGGYKIQEWNGDWAKVFVRVHMNAEWSGTKVIARGTIYFIDCANDRGFRARRRYWGAESQVVEESTWTEEKQPGPYGEEMTSRGADGAFVKAICRRAPDGESEAEAAAD